MPIAKIQLPDGRIGKFKVPDGTTPEQVIEYANNLFQNQGSKQEFQQNNSLNVGQQSNIQKKRSFSTSPEAVKERRQELKRDIGLGARAVLEGITTPVTLIPDLVALGLSAYSKKDIEPLSNVVSDGLSALGLPEAKTASERVAGDIIKGVSGGGAISKVIKNSKKVPKILKKSISNPKVDAIAGGGAGLGAGVIGEMGGGVVPQLAAGIIGGGVAGSTALKRLPKIDHTNNNLLSDVAESGIDETQSFSKVRSAIAKEASKRKQKVDDLYKAAKDKGQKAFVEDDNIDILADELQKELVTTIDPEAKQVLLSSVKALEDIKGGNTSINNIEGIRKAATRIGKTGGEKGYTGSLVARKIDGFLDKAKITGQEDATKTWKEAIQARREYASKFENPAKIAKAIDSDETLETIEQLFIGTGSISGKTDIAKTYQYVLNAVPNKSQKEVGFALRQSVLNRMIKTAAQASDTEGGISASRLSNLIRNLRRNNKSLWEKFKPEEKRILGKLEDDLRKFKEPDPIRKTFDAMLKFIRNVKNFELPRTLKKKTIVTIDDLLELSSTKPGSIKASNIGVSTSESIEDDK